MITSALAVSLALTTSALAPTALVPAASVVSEAPALSIGIERTDDAPGMLVSKRFIVENSTTQPLRLNAIEFSKVGDRFEGRPDVGAVLMPGGQHSFEVQNVLSGDNTPTVWYGFCTPDASICDPSGRVVGATLTYTYNRQTDIKCLVTTAPIDCAAWKYNDENLLNGPTRGVTFRNR
ncbi:hypothetical protein ET445_13670 [Agromyces protaetiae]|uniref:Uncharacterized protein n=1 Tax=Agromyces protaetiae TaxID=2509455 RepID=A0A4P6FJR4_9MICO|nr:hypothetical protein [Agromyces protaetiae]QAY74217.1 hypothetical protein ET445_13670 [Agromyces protaetiae]